MKDIREVIHLYLGCEVAREHKEGRSKLFFEHGKLVGVSESEIERGKFVAVIDVGLNYFHEWYVEETKLVRRKLSSMTEEQKILLFDHMFPTGIYGIVEAGKTGFIEYYLNLDDCVYHELWDSVLTSMSFETHVVACNWLRLNGFDCDRLLENNLAIEKV